MGDHVVTQVDALQKRGTVQPLLRDGDCGRLHIEIHTRRNLDLRSLPLRSGVKVKVFIAVASRVCLLSGVSVVFDLQFCVVFG